MVNQMTAVLTKAFWKLGMTALIALASCIVFFLVPAWAGLERESREVKFCFSREQPGTNPEYNPQTGQVGWCGFPNFESEGILEHPPSPHPVEDAPNQW